MKRKRHTPEQMIIRKLRTAEQLLNQGQSDADDCRALESPPTYHLWQQLCGGMKATEAKRLKELEQETHGVPPKRWTHR